MFDKIPNFLMNKCFSAKQLEITNKQQPGQEHTCRYGEIEQ
jgi:hypothetical protein